MPQSLSRLYVHLIFSTKDRQRAIAREVRQPLHAYLATVFRDQGCNAYRVGGTADHVHIVCALARTVTVSKLVENTKKVSSAWMKEQSPRYQRFYWQRGYGAFSLSPSHRAEVIEYVSDQELHHQKETYQEEFRRFLKAYDIEYDERYVWD